MTYKSILLFVILLFSLSCDEEGSPFSDEFRQSECGNNILEPGEECDGSDLGLVTCGDLGYEWSELIGNKPWCNATCTISEVSCGAVYSGDCCYVQDYGQCQDEDITFCVLSLNRDCSQEWKPECVDLAVNFCDAYCPPEGIW